MSLQNINVCTEMLLPHFKSDIIGFPISFLREDKWFINIFHFATHCINHWTDCTSELYLLSLAVAWDLAKGSFPSGHFLGLSIWKVLSWVNFDISFQLSFAILKVNSWCCCVIVVKTNQKELLCNFEAGVLLQEANQHYSLRYSLFFALTHNPSCAPLAIH